MTFPTQLSSQALRRMSLLMASSVSVVVLFGFLSFAHAATTSMDVVIPTPTGSIANPKLEKWQKNTTPQTQQDKLWQQGVSPEQLLNKDATKRMQPQAPTAETVGPHPKQGQQSPTAPEDDGLQLAGGAIKGDSEAVGSTWHAPSSNSMTIDENLYNEQHEVVGAYGQMVQNENFEMSLGPELYIPEEGTSVLGDNGPENSELGVGMKLQWGF